MKNIGEFFAYARERYNIKLRRDAGNPPPWTDDKVIASSRFCHVFREDDKTTVWFREHVRDPLQHEPKVIFATAAFRWFNRIEIGEIIKDQLLGEWDEEEVRRRLKDVRPVTTGAYMIRTPTGYNKLDGLLTLIGLFGERNSDVWNYPTLEEATMELGRNVLMGPFLAYEVVCDLMYTDALRDATDKYTWANTGPGAKRGIQWVIGEPHVMAKDCLPIMREILGYADQFDMLGMPYWPAHWPKWDMRTVEHTLCEFDKHCRGKAGQRLKRKYP